MNFGPKYPTRAPANREDRESGFIFAGQRRFKPKIGPSEVKSAAPQGISAAAS
jgi:hypothetical protein